MTLSLIILFRTNKEWIKKEIPIKVKTNNMILKIKSIGMMIFLFFSSYSYGIEYTYTIDAGYQDSSNITQVFDGESGAATDYGLGFSLSNSLQKEWELDLDTRFARTNYFGANLSDEKTIDLSALAKYKSSSSNFSFTTLANIIQAPNNRFTPQEINNIRQQAVYVLMPSYYIAINSADRINLFYTSMDYDLEDPEGLTGSQAGQARSSNGNSFLINYAKKINSTNTLALNFRDSETDFDENIATAIDYEREDTFLSWDLIRKTGQLRMELGSSKIVDQLNQELNLDHKLLSVLRQLNRENVVSLTYSKGFNNPLSNDQETNNVSVNQQNNDITAAQEVEDFTFNYTYTGDFLSATILFSDEESRQSFSDNVEERKRFTLNMTYLLSRYFENSGRSNIRINYANAKSEFESEFTNIQSTEIETYGITYNHVYSSSLTFSLSYAVRDSSQFDNNNDEFIIDSNSTFFTVTYSDFGHF